MIKRNRIKILKSVFNIFKQSLLRGCRDLVKHPMYLGCMIGVPLFAAVFFVTLLSKGVATEVPSAIVDLDRTPTSRNIVRTLDAFHGVDVKYHLDSYTEAMDYVKQSKIVGFIVIPEGFSSDALAMRRPELSYYINFSYYASASLMVKDYTTISALSNASLVSGTLSAMGMNESTIESVLQPYVAKVHALGNPWLDYGVYLANSFVPTLLALMVMIMTAYSITLEIKENTSRQWLETAGGSMAMALWGKLIPQTVNFTLVGWAIQVYFYGIVGYPLHCPLWTMWLAMMLLVMASQGFALIWVCIVPNLRLSLSVCCLIGMLSFSLAGLSFPVEQMYSWVGVLSRALPAYYYYEIYCSQALSGLEFAYSAWCYAALLAFTLVPFGLMWHLRKKCEHPVYIR